IGRAVVTNLTGNVEMIGRPLPEATDGRQRGRHAGLVMLANETYIKQRPPAFARRLLQTLDQPLVKWVVYLAGKLGGLRIIATVVGSIRTPRHEPVGQFFLQERRQLGKALVALAGLWIETELVLQSCQLQNHRTALDASVRFS